MTPTAADGGSGERGSPFSQSQSPGSGAGAPHPSAALLRARVEAYHSATHTADLQPILGPSARLSSVPVLEACSTTLIAAGDTVALILWPDGSALVLGPYGGVP